ncbi:hypothetical protein [Neomegalonema sp.]|uniref:hypothetical protein n=1 Tax=Neomegalonema sp. TaxID=2039713 RepID=UPI00262399ED|nr:hypothetical protein [Neomegalonema sp.]MDD2869224.1 hypothetical protein [Neomegalonema sp.]
MRSAAGSLGAAAGASLKGRAQDIGLKVFAGVFFAIAGIFLLLSLFFALLTIWEPWLAALAVAGFSAVLGGALMLLASSAKARARREHRILMREAERDALTQVSLLGADLGRNAASVRGLGLAALAGYILTRRR